jgi:peptidoglycan/LPS O-acetylase OafA/YrhL
MVSERHPPAGRLRRLECLRGAAALYVFVHHYVHVAITPQHPKLGLPFKFGQLAVLIFFVVSGFVIYYSSYSGARQPSEPSDAPGLEFRGYFIRRFRRIYPPFLVALLLTWLVQCLIVGGLADVEWRSLAGNVAMLQDENIASWFSPYINNTSLWSLSYEWAFYMMFFAVYALTRDRPRSQQWWVGGAAVLAFGVHQLWPNQIALFVMYFPIWWAGVELAREYLETGDVSVRRQLVPLLFVALIAAMWLIPVRAAMLAGRELVMWKYPIIELRHFVTAVVILVVALAWHKLRWRGFYTVLGPFEKLAPISYGLYIVHKPVVHLAATRAPLGNVWLELIWVVPVVFAIAWIVERWLHRYVLRLLPSGGRP